MILKLTLATLKTALVLGAVVLLDDMMADTLPKAVYGLLPVWCWLLPGERITQA